MADKKRVTIRDVAKEAGVSAQTVSRVINDRHDVASATRARVKEVIAALGYHPDPIARSLKGNSHTLGCISPGLADPIFSMIVEYAQAEARSRGFFILTGSAESTEEVEPLLAEMLNRRVEGLLVINPRDDNRHLLLSQLIDDQVPIVYLKNTPGGENVSSVSMNDVGGSLLAMRHLLDLGHTRIVTIIGRENEECVGDRLMGYRQALQEADITPDESLIVRGDWSPMSGSAAIDSLIQKGTPFTAVFAQNDRMAAGAIRSLRKAGRNVPEDVSVVGYDDIPLASYFDPPLTTIKQPMDQFGLIGVKMLIEAITNGIYKPRAVVLEPELIERSTCAAYRS